jgi:hypothetical protein
MRMPCLWKYWQLSNCHRHALREWLLALKRANLAKVYPVGLPFTLKADVVPVSANQLPLANSE